MENYADVLDAIVRDKKTAIQDEKNRKDAAEKVERARARKMLEPIITVLEQIAPKLEHKAYVTTNGFGETICKISCRNIYAKFNGALIAKVSPGTDKISVIEMDHDCRRCVDQWWFDKASEAIPKFLEAAANMLIHR